MKHIDISFSDGLSSDFSDNLSLVQCLLHGDSINACHFYDYVKNLQFQSTKGKSRSLYMCFAIMLYNEEDSWCLSHLRHILVSHKCRLNSNKVGKNNFTFRKKKRKNNYLQNHVGKYLINAIILMVIILGTTLSKKVFWNTNISIELIIYCASLSNWLRLTISRIHQSISKIPERKKKHVRCCELPGNLFLFDLNY